MKVMLLLAIAVYGYLIILSSVLAREARFAVKRTHGRYQSVPNQTLTFSRLILTLAIYGVAIIAILLASSYTGNLGMILYFVFGVISFAFFLWYANGLLSRKISLQPHVFIALLAYALAVLFVALFMRGDGINFEIQMELFAWLDKSGKGFQQAARHMLLNILMFVPFGALACLMEKDRTGQPLRATLFSMLLSVCIETEQLIRHAGTCDIDDILANMLGGTTGTVCVLLYSRICGGRERSAS